MKLPGIDSRKTCLFSVQAKLLEPTYPQTLQNKKLQIQTSSCQRPETWIKLSVYSAQLTHKYVDKTKTEFISNAVRTCGAEIK